MPSVICLCKEVVSMQRKRNPEERSRVKNHQKSLERSRTSPKRENLDGRQEGKEDQKKYERVLTEASTILVQEETKCMYKI
jgi:hypothetical protein